MRFVKFIYNASSGNGRFGHALDQIVSIYQKRGYSLIPYRLTFDKDEAETMVDDIENFCHHLLIAGGDGTINYVVNVLQTKGIKTPIAVLPAGTANDFAGLLGMPDSIPTACRAILSGEMREIDLARVNDLYFVNVFSCGLFTDVSQKTPTRLKHTFGKFAYYFSGMQEFPSFKKLQITVTSQGKE
ncbi:MAG: YegS/Rv2252/BmrU family lipid kinase, partial [Rikenellaceae bacterium]|nr:YegS/Rv2252/BmrU family lipid kinase [Rikenellaceae bacterium]